MVEMKAVIPLKRLLLYFAGYSGLLHLGRLAGKDRIAMFMLHGIVDEQKSSLKTIRKQCSVQRFEQVVALLGKYFEFVSLGDAVSMLAGERPFRPYCAVLTFDDGYRNNYTTALPVLKKYGIPATFFVPTGHINDGRPLWFDILDAMVNSAPRQPFTLSLENEEIIFDPIDRKQMEKELFIFLYRYNHSLQQDDIEFQDKLFSLLDNRQKQSGVDLQAVLRADEKTAIMDWQQVKEASEAGMTIGSHTVNHLKLSTLEPEQIREQLQTSKKAIEKYTGKPCRYLSYPNGDFDERVARIAGECGYHAAVTTESHLNEVGDDLYRLSRLSFPRRAEKFHILSHIYRGK